MKSHLRAACWSAVMASLTQLSMGYTNTRVDQIASWYQAQVDLDRWLDSCHFRGAVVL